MKKILLIDDSALMRTVLSDIINADSRFQVVDKAKDGLEGLELLKKNTYDAVVAQHGHIAPATVITLTFLAVDNK